LYISQLTFLRFLAAVTVVLFHFAPGELLQIAPLGVTAVSFFFFLSGVVLQLNYGKKVNEFKPFIWRRFSRIYPVYLLALTLTLLFGLFFRDAHPKGLSILLQVFAVQAWVPGYCTGVNFPAWSISVEFFFYAAFPFIARFFHTKSSTFKMLLILLIWGISFLQHVAFMKSVNGAEGSAFHQFTLYFPLWHLNTFLFGMLCGNYIQNSPRQGKFSIKYARGMYLTGFLLFILVVLIDTPVRPYISSGFLSPLFFLIIAGLALDKSILTRLLSHRLPLILGNASYALYILQWPVYILVTALLPYELSPLTLFWSYFYILLLLSIVVYQFVEKPARMRLVRKLDQA
jgi:peptidoglycan/LPS O-acetylase OafA/YrhL